MSSSSDQLSSSSSPLFRLKVRLPEGETRRLSLSPPPSFSELSSRVRGFLSLSPSSSFKVMYTDGEGDRVTVSSDSDLEEAFEAMRDVGTLALEVIVAQGPAEPAAVPPAYSTLPLPSETPSSPPPPSPPTSATSPFSPSPSVYPNPYPSFPPPPSSSAPPLPRDHPCPLPFPLLLQPLLDLLCRENLERAAVWLHDAGEVPARRVFHHAKYQARRAFLRAQAMSLGQLIKALILLYLASFTVIPLFFSLAGYALQLLSMVCQLLWFGVMIRLALRVLRNAGSLFPPQHRAFHAPPPPPAHAYGGQGGAHHHQQ